MYKYIIYIRAILRRFNILNIKLYSKSYKVSQNLTRELREDIRYNMAGDITIEISQEYETNRKGD
jgi:hypothetical protein